MAAFKVQSKENVMHWIFVSAKMVHGWEQRLKLLRPLRPRYDHSAISATSVLVQWLDWCYVFNLLNVLYFTIELPLRPVYTASFEHACFNMHVKTCCVNTVKSRLSKHVCLTWGIEHVLFDKSRHGKLTN